MKVIAKIVEIILVALSCPTFIAFPETTTKFKWLLQRLTAKRNGPKYSRVD